MESLFSERQSFRQIWLWLILLIVNCLFAYVAFKQIVNGFEFGEKPMSNTMLIISIIGSLLLSFFFFYMRLDTEVKKDGIYYRLFPFQLKFKNVEWTELSHLYVRIYSPLAEYGGWGIRIGLFGKGRAFNVSGNSGLQLIYKGGKRFLLGTQKAKELESVLRQLDKLTEAA